MKTNAGSGNGATRDGWGEIAIVAGIMALGLVLRLWGITYGFPYIYTTDEAYAIEKALKFSSGDLNPRSWMYPTAFQYLLFVVYGAWYAVGRVFGAFTSVADFKLVAVTAGWPFYLVGRLVAAFFGVAAIPLLYAVGKRAYGRAAGVLAAAFLAVMPGHVEMSQQTKCDTALILVAVFVTWCVLRIITTSDRKAYLLGGLAVGFAASLKYNGVLLAIAVAAAHVICGIQKRMQWAEWMRRATLASVAAILGFGLGSPFAFLDARFFLADFLPRYSAIAFGGLSGERTTWYWSASMMPYALGRELYWASLAGLAYALWRRTAFDWAVAAFVLGYYALIGTQRAQYVYWLSPVYPFLGLFAARMLSDMLAWTKLQGARYGLVLGGLCLCLTARPLMVAARDNHLRLQTDTRTLAKAWVEANIPPGSQVLMSWVGVPDLTRSEISRAQLVEWGARLGKSAQEIQELWNALPEVRFNKVRQETHLRGQYVLHTISYHFDPSAPGFHDARYYAARGIRYVIVSWQAEYVYWGKVAEEGYADRAGSFRAFQKSLDADGALLKEFRAEPGRVGPTLRIYKIPEALQKQVDG